MKQNVQIRKLNEVDLPSVYRLIQDTIDTSYNRVYPAEAIEFFKDYHSKESILDNATNGLTIVVECNSGVVGTGTLLGTNIRRVFVNPIYQYKGIGILLVQELERKASLEKYATLDLEASLVSRQFWESLGFVIEREDYIPVKNDEKLYYYKMTKTLRDS